MLLHCSVAKSCLTLCDPIDCSMPGSSVLHNLPEFAQIQICVLWVSDTQGDFCLHSLPASGTFPVSLLFASGCQNTGASASASVPPVNIQSRFPLGLTSLIFLQSKGLSYISSLKKKNLLHFNIISNFLNETQLYFTNQKLFVRRSSCFTFLLIAFMFGLIEDSWIFHICFCLQSVVISHFGMAALG